MTGPMTSKSYNLLRSFSILSLLSIAAISAISATLLARFLRENLLQRDAVVTMEFVQSIAQAQNTSVYFAEQDDAKRKGPLTDFFNRIAHMPDVVRANVYSRQRTILWSDEEHLTGKRFTDDNPELDRALAGELALETGQVNRPAKTEHILFAPDVDEFVENYIPIRDPQSGAVVGVVEIYKLPRVLMRTIAKGDRLVWLSALVGGLFLYGALFWIARRAGLTIRRQQQALVEAEKWAVIGELTAAVAHGLRNPLAAIRSSAELAQEEGGPPVSEYAADIIAKVDHLEKWVRELLIYSCRPGGRFFPRSALSGDGDQPGADGAGLARAGFAAHRLERQPRRQAAGAVPRHLALSHGKIPAVRAGMKPFTWRLGQMPRAPDQLAARPGAPFSANAGKSVSVVACRLRPVSEYASRPGCSTRRSAPCSAQRWTIRSITAFRPSGRSG